MKGTSQMIDQLTCYLDCALEEEIQKGVKFKSKEYSLVTFPKKVIYKIFASDSTKFTVNDIEKRDIIKRQYQRAGFELDIEIEYN